MSKRDAIQGHYYPRLSAEKLPHEMLDWASAESQQKRFEVLAENVELGGRKLLDVGCGLGDLLAYLRRRGIETDYTGVDLLQQMVDRCRERFDGGTFVRADVFAEDAFAPGAFDVVFVSGAFNLDLGNNLSFLPAALARLIELSRDCVVVNLLHARWPGREEGYFFYEPAFVLAQLARHAVDVTLLEDYLPNDFTVIVRKRPG